MERFQLLEKVRRLVVKVGSNCLTSGNGIDINKIRKLADEVVGLRTSGLQVIVVTSGAMAAGSGPLGLDKKMKDMSQKQAAVAVGQPLLMELYRKEFARHNVVPAQILLTDSDFCDRQRYTNSKRTIEVLLKRGAVPVINENDTVSTEEIVFGDNDMLSALVTNLIEASLLVILTNVDGLLDMDNGRTVRHVQAVDKKIQELIKTDKSSLGTGGMVTKIKAMKTVMECGAMGVIADSSQENVLARILAGEEIGTFFAAVRGQSGKPEKSRRKWLKYGTAGKGRIVIDAGAVKALLAHKSLLAIGITDVQGKFTASEIVDVLSPEGRTVARGIVRYDSQSLEKIKGWKTTEIARLFGSSSPAEVIHSDDLALLEKTDL